MTIQEIESNSIKEVKIIITKDNLISNTDLFKAFTCCNDHYVYDEETEQNCNNKVLNICKIENVVQQDNQYIGIEVPTLDYSCIFIPLECIYIN